MKFELVEIEKIDSYEVQDETVYDLTVEDDHSYCVSDSIIVHNSGCLTRHQTHIGIPQLSAVIECADAAHGVGGLICSDGGIRQPGHVAAAIGGGADFVMIGGYFRGHDENEGEFTTHKYNKYTKYTKKNHNTNEVTSILGFNKTFINDIKKKHGARTIHDFRKYLNSGSSSSSNDKSDLKLTHIQHLGLKCYEDLQDLIPRDEITYLGNLLKKEIEHNDNSNKYTMLLSGSYPSHSKEYSKDIDIIIVRNKEESYSGELKDIIEKICNDKYKDKYKDKNKDKNKMKLETISLGDKKFMGLLHSPKSNKMRHIDIRFVNLEELPYTWLYYSSGQIFNKLIRDKLKKKGYKLNEYGLYKGDGKEQNYIKVKIDMNPEYNLLSYIENIEKQIFKIADMEYKTVRERY